ncbi:MAG: tyrosine-protein phosphatase [Candidatus Sericytochromatia bacterium]
MNKKYLLLSSLGVVGLGIYLYKKNEVNPTETLTIKTTEEPKKIRFTFRRNKSKISRTLNKILSTIDNNRLLFVEIKTKGRSSREAMLKNLETLRTDEPVGDIWIPQFHKQKFSREDIIALTNKKTILYLVESFEEIDKISMSTGSTVGKIIGSSLSKLSTKYPAMEKYVFEPMLDLYAPLKDTDSLNNFGIVKENQLYRGGTPVGESHYDRIAELGIKTVVNLKVEDSAVEYVNEQTNLAKKDIQLHYIPMPNIAAPTLLQVLEFLTICYNDETKPVFVHCHRGSDRTGIVSAAFRITEGHRADWALAEAQKFNIASNIHTTKIEFIYDFEKKWLKWKEEGHIPNNLINFDFTNLINFIEEDKEIEDEKDLEEEIHESE